MNVLSMDNLRKVSFVFQGPPSHNVCGYDRAAGPVRRAGRTDQAPDPDLQEEPRGHGSGPVRSQALSEGVSVAVQSQAVELQYGQRNRSLRQGNQRR